MCCVSQAEEVEPARALNLAQEGNRRNYAAIDTARGTLITVRSDSDEAIKRFNEMNAKIDAAPKTGLYGPGRAADQRRVHRQKFLIAGEKQRHDGGIFPDAVTVILGDEVTLYRPDTNSATVQPRSERSLAWRDPRELEFPSEDYRLNDVLSNCDIARAETVKTGGGESLRVGLTTKGPKPKRMIFEFDQSKNYLPSFWAELHEAGGMAACGQVDYEQVQPGKVWFPKAATYRVYFATDIPVRRDAKGWIQMHRYEIHDLKINGAVDAKEFVIDYPPGTAILDSIRNTNRQL